MSKNINVSDKTHGELKKIQKEEDTKTLDGAIRILLERHAKDERSK